MASLADNDGAGQIGAQLLTKKKLPPLHPQVSWRARLKETRLLLRNEELIFRMPRVIREPSLTEKTQTWVEIRKAVPAMKHVGVNPGEVNGGSHKILHCLHSFSDIWRLQAMHTQNILADKSFALQVLMWSQERGLDEVVGPIPCLRAGQL